jgi:hypothetical protein
VPTGTETDADDAILDDRHGAHEAQTAFLDMREESGSN